MFPRSKTIDIVLERKIDRPIKSVLSFVSVLRIISNSEGAHGYNMALILKESSDGELVIDNKVLYSSLKALEKEGFLEGFWVTTDAGKMKKCYKLTDEGKELVTESETRLKQWGEIYKRANRRVME